MELRIESKWYVGVDLGQSHDPTAICVLETKTAHIPDCGYPYHVPRLRKMVNEFQKPYNVVHLERLPLGMSYPDQVLYVAGVISRAPLKDPMTYIDYTGVGRPVYDLFKAARLPGIKGVAITAGSEVHESLAGHTVPKNILVSRVQALLHTGQLKVAAGLLDAPALLKELKDFRVTFTTAGHAIFNARQGQHDDLVLALALAVFGASRPRPITSINMKWAM